MTALQGKTVYMTGTSTETGRLIMDLLAREGVIVRSSDEHKTDTPFRTVSLDVSPDKPRKSSRTHIRLVSNKGAACEKTVAQHLTAREAQITEMLCRGESPTQISEKLVISVCTTNRHIYNIYRKLGIRSQRELFTWYYRFAQEG